MAPTPTTAASFRVLDDDGDVDDAVDEHPLLRQPFSFPVRPTQRPGDMSSTWGSSPDDPDADGTAAAEHDDDDDDDDDDWTRAVAALSSGERHHGRDLTRPQALNLYLSHALSTWNARGYEFGAVLFTAAAYPGTLVAASARMIIIYLAMIIFSSSIGSWVDRSPSRLRTLLTTIICNRGSVIVGSLFWLAILSQQDLLLNEAPGAHDVEGPERDLFFALPTNATLKGIGFALATCCGIAERLSASGNLLSMERDWVPTVAAARSRAGTAVATPHVYDLTHLNAVMRRIDLACKLFAPVVLSLVISLSGSTRAGVVFTALTSAACVPVEMVSARSVWRASRALQEPKRNSQIQPPAPPTTATTATTTLGRRVLAQLSAYPRDMAMYLSSPYSIWIPSLALAMLHFNMLTWGATFITYLLTVGYPLGAITAARTAGSLFEISSTVVTPWLVVRLGRVSHSGHLRRLPAQQMSAGRDDGDGGDDDDDDAGQRLLPAEERGPPVSPVDRMENGGSGGRGEGIVEDAIDRQTLTGLQRVGLWGITWQVANTIPVVLAIWHITSDLSANTDPLKSSDPAATTTTTTVTTTTTGPELSTSIVLFAFLSLSRLGVWVFDLTTQQLSQTLVPPGDRSTFAGVEGGVTSVFELAGALASIAFPDPRLHYPWLAAASLAACVLSWAVYAGWVRRRRGHLVHLDSRAAAAAVSGWVAGECLKTKR